MNTMETGENEAGKNEAVSAVKPECRRSETGGSECFTVLKTQGQSVSYT